MTEEQRVEFEKRMERKTAPGWYGLAVPKSWYEIIDRLDKDLEEIVPGHRLLQAKAKFGGLRYYVRYLHTNPKEIIEQAERRIRMAEREVDELNQDK